MAIGQTGTTIQVIVTTPISPEVSALLAGSVRWNTTAAGVSGVVVDWFANWPLGQIGTITSVFAAWSDVANITFRRTTLSSDAEIIFQKSTAFNGGVSGLPLMAADNSPFRPGNSNFVDPDTGLVTASRGVVYTILNTAGMTGNATNAGGLDAFGNVAQGYNIVDSGRNFTAEGYNLLLHEIGHALGLKHPHSTGPGNTGVFAGVTPNDATDLGDNLQNQAAYSAMSYNLQSFVTSAGVVLQTVETPMAYDIAAMQVLYGAKMSTRMGSDTYELDHPGTTPSLRAIWDTAGIDQIVYNGSSQAVIDLRAATLDGSASGGGYRSYTLTNNGTGFIGDGFVIAGDVLGVLADSGTERGVVIENASGGSNDDLITGNGADNILRGNGGRDLLQGLGGNDMLDGGIGADWMYGFAGNDIFIVDNVGDFVSDGGTDGGVDTVRTRLGTYSLGGNADIENLEYTGNNTFGGFGNALNNVITGGRFGDTLAGLDGEDTLNGGNGADTLDGGRGSDTLDGGLGADFMAGGEGNDTYRVNNAGDRVFESASPAGGIDTVQTTRNSYTLDPNVENLRFDGTGRFTGLGNGLVNLIIGGARNDVLEGRGGADTLMGLNGNDTLDGGAGSDTADYSFETLAVVASLAAGTATTNNGAFVDTLVSIENLTAGLGSDVFTGNGGENTFTYVGSFGRNFDTGGLDTYAGRNGIDTIDVVRLFASATVDLAGGIAFAHYSYSDDTGGSAGTKIIANLTSIENATGSNFDDTLIGSGLANVLNGGFGNDFLEGGAGGDQLVGGEGSDTAAYTGSSAGVTIDLATGLASGGDAAGDTYVSIENLTGSAFGDSLTGDAGANTISGGGGDDVIFSSAGADFLYGGLGNDLIGVDNNDFVRGGEGHDTVNADTSTIANGFIFNFLGTEIEYANANHGNDVVDATGMTTTVTIVGFRGNDILTGGSGDDVIYGFEDDDIINGGAGFDQLIGGDGNDTIRGGGGPDVLYFTDWLYGEAGDDTLYGSGNGVLVGGFDNDTIFAGAGDLVIGSEGDDAITSSGAMLMRLDVLNSGNDTVSSYVDNSDKIWFHFTTGITGMDALTISDSAGNAVIAFGDNSTITLVGINASQLTTTDFIF
jgi:Ca2+-binding RTX toxin-like protein